MFIHSHPSILLPERVAPLALLGQELGWRLSPSLYLQSAMGSYLRLVNAVSFICYNKAVHPDHFALEFI